MPNLKPIPEFKSEDEERDFWATHSSIDYIDWSKAIVNPVFPNLKPSREVSSLRPKSLRGQNKQGDNKRNPICSKERDVP